jgi:hypothetical protein
MIQILNPFKAAEEVRNLKSERKWVLALVIVFVPGLLSVAGNGLIQQKTQSYTTRYVEEMGALTETQRKAIENIQGFIATIGIVVGIVFIAAFWILKSVVFHMLARVFGGNQAEISSTIHLVAYAYLPLIFKGLIDIYRGVTYELPSYEEFMFQIQHSDALLNFIREHNMFFIWSLLLMAIVVREQYNLSKKKAALVVLIPYVVVWVAEFALTSIGTQSLGGI